MHRVSAVVWRCRVQCRGAVVCGTVLSGAVVWAVWRTEQYGGCEQCEYDERMLVDELSCVAPRVLDLLAGIPRLLYGALLGAVECGSSLLLSLRSLVSELGAHVTEGLLHVSRRQATGWMRTAVTSSGSRRGRHRSAAKQQQPIGERERDRETVRRAERESSANDVRFTPGAGGAQSKCWQ